MGENQFAFPGVETEEEGGQAGDEEGGGDAGEAEPDAVGGGHQEAVGEEPGGHEEDDNQWPYICLAYIFAHLEADQAVQEPELQDAVSD